jgi:hypothetical protein
MVLCAVCCKSEKKYCCPKCSLDYCSLGCFKLHKEGSVCEDRQQQAKDGRDEFANGAQEEQQEAGYQFATADTVPLERLQQLAASEELRGLLANPHLRHFLSALDRSEEKGRLMRKAMREPLFVEFVDTCLAAIGEKDNSREMTDQEVLQAVQDKIEEEQE